MSEFKEDDRSAAEIIAEIEGAQVNVSLNQGKIWESFLG